MALMLRPPVSNHPPGGCTRIAPSALDRSCDGSGQSLLSSIHTPACGPMGCSLTRRSESAILRQLDEVEGVAKVAGQAALRPTCFWIRPSSPSIIAASPIDPTSGQEPHARAITSRQTSKAIQLNLVNPALPPASGLGAGLGRQGSMKPFGRGRIRNTGYK
jgi:hypothetical protein